MLRARVCMCVGVCCGAAVSPAQNWFNAASVGRVGAFLRGELAAVRAAIADCRTLPAPALDTEFEATCQRVMRANCGMDSREWLQLLAWKLTALLAARSEAPGCHGPSWSRGDEGGTVGGDMGLPWHYCVEEVVAALRLAAGDAGVAEVAHGLLCPDLVAAAEAALAL